MSLHKNSDLMALALEQARLAALRGEVPVGAVLVNANNEILAVDSNRTIELSDPTAHAEMLVIRKACQTAGSQRLTDASLYVTLEPCPMCAAAISFARITSLYFGASDPKSGGILSGSRIYSHPNCHHKPDVYDGICETQSGKLLKDFFAEKRK